MEPLGSIFLFLHIGGAIAAFGPTIAFPLIAGRASAEPQHGNFALRNTQVVMTRVVEPGAVFVLLMGLGLIWARDWNPFSTLWLGLSIIVFLITLGYSVFVQRPTIKRMVEMTSTPPPAPVEGYPPAGPPPEFVAASRHVALGGLFMTVMLVIILFLMVFKPTFGG
jgi:Predicted integral membrane protein (DUF2269)